MASTPTPPLSGPSPSVNGNVGGVPGSRQNPALGIVALVLGILAVIFSFIPVVNIVAFILAVAAIVCGLISLIRRMAGKAMAVVGLVLSVVAIVIGVAVDITVANAISSASHEISKSIDSYSAQASAKHSIEYKITTNGPAAVTYWAPDGTSQDSITSDWTKDLATTGLTTALVTVTASDVQNASASVSCEIFIDGKSVAKHTGAGSLASASCTGTAN